MASRKTNSSRKLSFQALENRCLMAGNVTVAVQNGILTITGDNKANEIQVLQTGPNSYQVFDSFGGGTKVNGSAAVIANGVTGDVKINLNGGDDLLVIGDGINGEATHFMSLPRNLNVSLGAGRNQFRMYGTSVGGKVSVTGGADGNTVEMYESGIGSSTVNGGANDCTLSLGAGDNQIVLSYTPVERDLNILDENSHSDHIAVDGGNFGRYLYVQTGSGNDSVQVDEVNVGLKLQVATGGGNDKVILGGYDATNEDANGAPAGVWADQVFVDLGKGDDVLQLGGSHDTRGTGGVYANQATYLGGDGNDQAFDYNHSDFQSVQYSGFEQRTAYIDLHFSNVGGVNQTVGAHA